MAEGQNDDSVLERKHAYWHGFYEACRRLTTSPRMNRPQREVIADQGMLAKDELEALGVKFKETEAPNA